MGNRSYQPTLYFSDRTSNKIRKIALSIVDDMHKLFVLCADLEWIDEKDPENRTLAHEILRIIIEDYLCTVTAL